ncbi:MAG: 6-carboxytetrahydropterin synthase [Planctomycetaceae bacterium]|nr:6-carboxytetrahydropterin synthase [Planctomycetaceae bacterium]
MNKEGMRTWQPGKTPVVEPLHGHTFRTKLEICGLLDEFSCVIDFVTAERILKQILERFEHKILVAERDSEMKWTENKTQVQISVLDKNWSFPKSDVLLLPVTNTSTEMIAGQIIDEFVKTLEVNRILPFPLDRYDFALTLEEETGVFAKVQLATKNKNADMFF